MDVEKMEYLLLALAVLSLVLHAVKGYTKTKVDDVAADVTDAVIDGLKKDKAPKA